MFMVHSTHQKTVRPNRQYYFNMIIRAASSPKNLKKTVDFLNFSLKSNFTSQKYLESVLCNLKIIDRGRQIFLDDFDVQLERNSRGIPYWNLYLKTTALITGRCLARKIAKELFNADNLIDRNIDITPLSDSQRCNREKLFSIPESRFYPGHFSKTLLKFEELLKNEEVREAIQGRPDKYQLVCK